MTIKFSFAKKLMSAVLCLALILSCLPFSALGAEAGASAGIGSAYGGTNNKISDPATVNDWKLFFGPHKLDTTYAGGVWTDKSVFNSVADYLAATDEEEGANFGLELLDNNHFLVALSAIASSKSVEGYSALPSDTILALDLSASMITNQAVSAMVQATNDAITRLQELNANNRVSVIAYSGNSSNGYSSASTAEVILPLGRYTAGVNGAYLVSSWTTGSYYNSTNHTGVKVAEGVKGTVAEGVTATFSTSNSKDASGGTYIQNGLYQAWLCFDQITSITIDEGLQAGAKRLPVMVLLSDGAPTAATTNYSNVGTSNSGDGTSNYATAGTAFMTQLTAAWVRDKMKEKYGSDPLIYSLGLNVGSNEAAQNVLNPSNNTATDAYWDTFIGLAEKDEDEQSMTVEIRPGYYSGRGNDREWHEPETRTINYTAPISADGWSEDYITQYFPASNASGLIRAFGDIVQNIIIQSLYYPTLVEAGNSINHDGFLDFEDYIGKNMEVKAIKGIQLGNKLYTGETLARMIYEGGMGTEANPTDAGNNLVWSVQARLGIDTVAQARTLIGQAYASGQLYYDPETGEFSNYIGWYADGTGKFVAFWDGTDASLANAPQAAVFANKSYGFYDAVGDGHRKTDMMYATILVRTTLKTEAEGKHDASEAGDIRVIGRLPASLIPLVEYNVDLNGIDPLDPAALTVAGATAPSRLLYEVGVSSKFDLLDVENTAPYKDAQGNVPTDENGNYLFYTNQWHESNHYLYTTNKNTISYFEPSVENERYYYNTDTPIYTDTNGTLYKGDAAPVYSQTAPYYQRTLSYKTVGNAVKAEWAYEQISQYVLEDTTDLQKLEDNSWIVKRGTRHHYFGDYIMEKSENATGTLNVSDQPFVHEPHEGKVYGFHVDSYLGNNGKLTIEPLEGIKITKTADSTIVNRNQTYTFSVEAENDATFAETLVLITQDAAGARTESTVTFENGKATVTLQHGQAAFIVGEAMSGKTFTVSEVIPANAEYKLFSVNGDENSSGVSLEVESGVIKVAAFVNTMADPTVPTITPVDVTIHGTKYLQGNIRKLQARAYQFELVKDGEVVQTVYNGTPTGDFEAPFAFEALTFFEAGTYTYTVREKLPAGASAENNYTLHGVKYDTTVHTVTVEVTDDGTGVLAADVTYPTDGAKFTNTYSVSPTFIDFAGVKTLQGDALSKYTGNAAFKFNLYAAAWSTQTQGVEQGDLIVSVTNDSDGKFYFDHEDIDALNFSAVGANRFILREYIPDETDPLMVYDTSVYYIEVDVTDDLQGGLTATPTITKFDAKGTISTVGMDQIGFHNLLEKEPVSVEVGGKKNYNVTLPADMFAFELYQAMIDEEETIYAVGDAILEATNKADGTFVFEEVLLKDALSGLEKMSEYLTFDQAGEYYFVVKEKLPEGVTEANKTKDNITYDTTAFALTVIVTDEVDETGRAILSYELLVNDEADEEVVFTNTYTEPEPESSEPESSEPEPDPEPEPEPENPDTGVRSDLWMWFALAFVSGFGAFSTTLFGKAKKNEP